MAFRLQLLLVLVGGAAGAGHKADWSAVCELETTRAAAEKAARNPKAVRVAAPQTPTLRLSVEGGRSNEGVPLTVAAGRFVHASYVGGGKRHLTTAISVDGTPSCPGTGHESTVAVEMSVQRRALRKRGHHHRHRFKRHTSHEHESKYSALRPSERVVIDAVLCDGRKKSPSSGPSLASWKPNHWGCVVRACRRRESRRGQIRKHCFRCSKGAKAKRGASCQTQPKRS